MDKGQRVISVSLNPTTSHHRKGLPKNIIFSETIPPMLVAANHAWQHEIRRGSGNIRKI
jgi:hypothetical protein